MIYANPESYIFLKFNHENEHWYLVTTHHKKWIQGDISNIGISKKSFDSIFGEFENDDIQQMKNNILEL